MIGFPSLLRLKNIPLYVYNGLLTHSSISGQSALLLFSDYCESWCHEHGSACICSGPAFNSFGYVPRSGIAGLYDDSVFNFLRKLHSVFLCDCTILLPTNSTGIPKISLPASLPTLVLFGFSDNSHPNGCKVVSTVVLSCISWTMNAIKHYFYIFVPSLWSNAFSSYRLLNEWGTNPFKALHNRSTSVLLHNTSFHKSSTSAPQNASS